MSNRPTPETDAMEYDDPLCDPPKCVESCFARRLERERDEARELLELYKAANRDVERIASERDQAQEELAAERALADRLAGVMFGCTGRDMNDAYDAWKEARK